MDRTILSPTDLTREYIAVEIERCTKMLQEAANYMLEMPELSPGTYLIQTSDGQPYHRLIIGYPPTLQLERPYMVGFCGIRASDPDDNLSEKLIQVDDRLIETIQSYQIGLYNTARYGKEYKNTALLPDKASSKRWAAENALHQSAVDKLTPKCYQTVVKFTGYVDGWPEECRIAVDEAIYMTQ